jgi:catechol 2,3-dioxygenase-like lactoylglutathione lyase family enzyme
MCLTVKDLPTSRKFYEQLGFTQVSGMPDKGWIVLKNGPCRLGLFQGMFEKNMLTFNPGWDSEGQPVTSFMDVRAIQKELKAQGIALSPEADETTTGPAYFMTTDPDGNPILVDQHV